MIVKAWASASTAARSLSLFALLSSCAPERVHEPAVVHEVEHESESRAPRETTRRSAGGVLRRDVTIGAAGLAAALNDAGLAATIVDDLDDAFVWRLDLHAHLRAGDALTLWHRAGQLVAVKVPMDDDTLMAALYDGDLAPHGFYDQDGLGMRGSFRSRPLDLGRITSRYGQRFDAFTGAPAFHRGVDYGVPVGTPVVAVGAGRVKAIGNSARAGNFIKLAHAGGYESSYLHLDRVDVRKGDVVDANRVIGKSGNTGRSTGPHLHYELRLAGIALDPLATMPPSTVALGPLARREHLAFIRELEQMEDTQ